MKVYLAGKVSKLNWRDRVCGDQLRAADGNGDWRAERFPFLNGHTYTGPFFVACDHGCSHIFGEHGVTFDLCAPDWVGAHDALGPGRERAYRAPGPDIVSAENGQFNQRRSLVFNKCKRAIDDSDLVFAWLDDPSAYGTIWELGYAAGRGIDTAIGIPSTLDMSDLWFPVYGAGQVYRALSPVDAIGRSLARFNQKLRYAKCESPIETAMLTAILAAKPDCVAIEPQFSVDNYRLDFALFGRERKVAVECDGHDFHERSKEQAKHDRQRDRRLTSLGWTVARFTGSEIHANSDRCAREALDMLLSPGAAQ